MLSWTQEDLEKEYAIWDQEPILSSMAPCFIPWTYDRIDYSDEIRICVYE